MHNDAPNDLLNTPAQLETEAHIERIIKDILQFKKNISLKAKPFFANCANKTKRENFILSLTRDLHYVERQHDCLKLHFGFLHKQTDSSASNRDGIKLHCQLLQEEMREFVAALHQFDTTIAETKSEKNRILRANEAVIANKLSEKQQLEDELEKITSKVDGQLTALTELKSKRALLEKTYIEDKQRLEAELNEQEGRYEELLRKFNSQTEHRANLNEWERRRSIKEIREVEKRREEDKEREEGEILLQDKRIMNEFLLNTKSSLNEKIDMLRCYSIAASTIGSGRYNSKMGSSDLKSLIGSPKRAENIKFRSLSTSLNDSIAERFTEENKK